MAKTRRAVKHGSKKRSTRRSRGGYETIEGLQASFEKIDAKARALIDQGRTDTELIGAMIAAWSDIFGADLSHTAATGLIKHYRSIHKTRKTRKGRRQAGGMAPLGWTMGQGTTDFTYGRFPVEIGTSPSVVESLDRYYRSSISSSCDLATRQGGGGLWDTAVTMGHPPTSVPANALQGVVTVAQGGQPGPSASPVSATVPVPAYEPKPFQPGELTKITELPGLYKPL
jgi:hypothetical protein